MWWDYSVVAMVDLQSMFIVIHTEFDIECCILGPMVYCNSAYIANPMKAKMLQDKHVAGYNF